MMRYFLQGRRKPRRSAEEIAEEKAAKDRKAMTCQCCGRRIFAETGLIAHHGYERPGYGYQTASCMGARYLPFEVDRSRLAVLIGYLENWLVRDAKLRADIEAERIPIDYTFTDYHPTLIGKKKRVVQFTRETFAHLTVQKENVPELRMYGIRSFDELKERELDTLQRKMKNLARDIRTQRKRFNAWRQTHAWSTFYNPPQWVKCETVTET